jgi:O-antigen/teichoic acid export membrane protein
MTGRISKAKVNIVFGLGNKIITMILEFIVRSIFIKILGEELLGVNGVFTNVIQVLSLAELGLNNVVAYSFYEPIAENNYKKIAALVRFYKKIYIGIALAVLGIGVCLIPFLNILINTNIEISNIPLVYSIFLADTVISYLFVYKVTLLRSDQRSYIAFIFGIVMSVLRVGIQIICLIVWKNFILYLIVKVLFSCITNFVTARYVDKRYQYIKLEGDLDKKTKKTIIDTVKSGFIYKVSAVLLNSTDNILISILVGTVWVGYLANYITIITAISSICTIVFTNLTASVGNLVATENEEKRYEIFNIMMFISGWMAIVFSSCIQVLSEKFIVLWLGEKFVMSFPVVIAKTLMLFLMCYLQPVFSYREALGLYRKTKYAMILAAVLNLILSIFMGMLWGVAGILIASLIAILSTYFWYEPCVLYKENFHEKVGSYFFKAGRTAILFVFVTVVLYIIGDLIQMSGWMGWIVEATVLFMVANLICFVIYYRNKDFQLLVQKTILKK